MRVFVTGHDGYIGTVLLVQMLQESGHEVNGLDNEGLPSLRVRRTTPAPERNQDGHSPDIGPQHLDGYDAVMHLAGISNDPAGDLNPEATYEINHRATVRLAEAAKHAGVGRFLFAASCSIDGARGGRRTDGAGNHGPRHALRRVQEYAEADITNWRTTYLQPCLPPQRHGLRRVAPTAR